MLAVKKMKPKEDLPLLVVVKKIDALVQLVLSVVDLGIKLRRLLPLVLLVVDPKIK